jgi:hypothetical protein
MITRIFTRSALHEHAEPAQRILGVAELPPDSAELAGLVVNDPAPEVRAAAARRCGDAGLLAERIATEQDAEVRSALSEALVGALAAMPDAARASDLLGSERCSDAIRAEVAKSAPDAERRRAAIAGIGDDATLADLALAADHADTRLAAAERVRAPEHLRRLAEAARNKDHGVARLVRQRLDALAQAADRQSKADAIIVELAELAVRPGPIVSALVDLDRRWQALDMGADAAESARHAAARRAIQERFEREQNEQRSKARFDRALREWVATLAAPTTDEGFAATKATIATLREDAQQFGDADALALLDTTEQQVAQWVGEHRALADAEALVVEAEQLAASTSIDNAKLPERWQALDRAIRTPALTRRFEAALLIVEQRRLEQIRAAQQEASVARAQLHTLLHTAEQALAAGQLAAARAAVDDLRARKADAGTLPKPTTQRLGRVLQQLGELERWESFGQRNARVQLAERAEALADATLDPPQRAIEVQKLRNEWKALDAQHAGVPKALWERFDHACERAYAPAAKHFAELAAQRKEARRKREEFIAAVAAHAPTLLTETPDWRAIERWLRETDQAWREGGLGSVEPGAWKKLDARFKEGVAPLRDALAAARDEAKRGRLALITEAVELAPKALERDAPSKVKAIQARWQEHAKAFTLPQRDERALWEQFRAACDAVFSARQTRRKEDDGRKHEGRRALEEICVQLEQLAGADRPEPEMRRLAQDLAADWRRKGGGDPTSHALETRFRHAKSAVDAAIAGRARSREAAVWKTLAAKERLCEGFDRAAVLAAETGATAAPDPALIAEWDALAAMPPAWDKKIGARRDAALQALADPTLAHAHRERIASCADKRKELLLELEIALGLDTPAELAAQRLALQVQQLRERFKSGSANTPGERLLEWCALPGVPDARDRQRGERVFAAIERLR